MNSPQKLSPTLEKSTIERQRQELQLLIAELKDRDKELSDMVAMHQRQLRSWEDDRQKLLTLSEQCNLLKNELNKRNEIIKSLTKRLKFLESQQNDSKMSENTQQNFKELSQKEKNQRTPCSVLELSAKTNHLQAGEQERFTVLKLKDELTIETTTSKSRKRESLLGGAKTEEFILNKERQDLELRLKELILETNKLKDDLCEKTKENNKQQEEILHLKQENECLRQELALAVEKAKTKDQLLQFAKSKQARTDAELSSLRQIYIKQLHDLQFLHVNLESSQELSRGTAFFVPESNSQIDTVWTEGTHRICEKCGTAQYPKRRVKTTSETCEVDDSLLLNTSNLEETTSKYLNQCQKVVKVLAGLAEEEEKQDVASSSDQLSSIGLCEANNTRPLRNRETSENGVESRDRQTFQSSLLQCKHCLKFSSCVDSQNSLSQNTVTADKSDNENKTWQERTEILFDQKSRDTPVAMHKSESDSRSDDFIIKKDVLWKPVSDQEWLKIFKPIKGDGNIQHGKDFNCLKTAQEMKCASSKSEENVDLNSFHLDSPCLTSTQKRDRPRRCEKCSDEDFPLEIDDLPGTKQTNRTPVSP
ncbi:coiled-coil domain-containing protein 62 isoform X2 [Cuculus canorus]|uniref:coiled-coil domain-containing protein 62 isoform X2 n=1 Tax=Cuculus canorus TaxID=55661 RepID=UPI0023AA7B8B|nr:coiled-coil domain-containing protein 62 isoform X2 [Cuculus canorus]